MTEPDGGPVRPTGMRRIAVLLTLLMTPLMWVGAEPAFACSCVQRTVPELVDAADAVVLAQLKDVQQEGGPAGEVRYTFMGRERFKGDLTPGFEVRTAATSAACGLSGLVVGRRYVVFMDHQGEEFTASLCGGTAPGTPAFVREVEDVTGQGMSFPFPQPPAPTFSADALVRWFLALFV